jgi:hypothetical protein
MTLVHDPESHPDARDHHVKQRRWEHSSRYSPLGFVFQSGDRAECCSGRKEFLTVASAVHIRLVGWHFSISSNQWAPTICVCSSAPFRYFHAVALKKNFERKLSCFFPLLPQRDWAFFVPWLHFWRGFYHTACGMCAAEQQHVNTQKVIRAGYTLGHPRRNASIVAQWWKKIEE